MRMRVRMVGGGVALLLGAMLAVSGCSETGEAGGDSAAGGETAAAGPLKKFTVTTDGKTHNLGDGEYLVAMLSATCEHCQASVPRLNEMATAKDHAVTHEPIPPLVGIMLGSEEEIQAFKDMTSPVFPTQRVETLDFFQFIDTAPPRLIYDRNGHVVQAWDWEELEDMPSIEDVEQAIAQG